MCASPTTLTKYLMGGGGGEELRVRGGESWVHLLQGYVVGVPGGRGGLGGQDVTRVSIVTPGELFISLRSTLEQHYGWHAAENKEAKAFST